MHYPQLEMKISGHFHTLSTLTAKTRPVVLTA